MRRVMYAFLPDWPIDRVRRLGRVPGPRPGKPGREAPFATVAAAPAEGRRGGRLLAAVNPAAAAGGLAPGMPLADALSFVPDLLTASAEPAADAAALIRLAEWCGRYSPWTAPDGTDGIRIEITGCVHLWGGLWGGEERLAADLAHRLARQNLATRIAIAGTPGAASALARFAAEPGRPALPGPGGERDALAPLPVEALRLDPEIAAGLRRVGLHRIGDLYPMPRAALVRRFGEAVSLRLDQALGAVAEPLSPLRETPVRQVRLDFAEPVAAPEDLARAIESLAAGLAARLEREGGGARRLDLAFRRVDGRVEHIRVGTARPSREARHLAGLLAARLETVDPGLGVEDMTLALLAAEKLAPEQGELKPLCSVYRASVYRASVYRASVYRDTLPPGQGEGDAVTGSTAPLLDRLGARLGLAGIGRLAARASHIPERASRFVPIGVDLHPSSGGMAVSSPVLPSRASRKGMETGCRGETVGIWPQLLRPIRLFRPPEPVEAAWVLPDEPPFRFIWRHRAHRVRRAEGPERIAEEWWTLAGAAAAVSAGALRDYYRVEDDEGRRFWLFRPGLPGVSADRDMPLRWFIHGVFA